MIVCKNCGKEISDGVFFCAGCGATIAANEPLLEHNEKKRYMPGRAIRIFFIIGTVLSVLMTGAIALAWCLPMLRVYQRRVKEGLPIGTGFGVLVLLFVSRVAGVLMLLEKVPKAGEA